MFSCMDAADIVWIPDFIKRALLCASSDKLTFSVWFCASFHEPDGVLDELAAGFDKLHDLIHVGFGLKRRKTRTNQCFNASLQNRMVRI